MTAIWRSVLLLAALVLLPYGPTLAESAPKVPLLDQPAWHVDFQALGVTEPGPRVGQVAFAGENKLAVTILGYHETIGPRRGQTGPRPFLLHLISFDASTGRIAAHRAWPGQSWAVELASTLGGNVAIQVGSRISLYSPDLEELKTLDLPTPPHEFEWRWRMLVSPTGRSVFLEKSYKNNHTLKMIDPQTLREVHQRDEVTEVEAVSDKVLAAWRNKAGLYVRSLDSVWRRMEPAETTFKPSHWFKPRFLSDNVVVLVGSTGPVVLTTQGKLLFSDEFPRHQPLPFPAVASADGNRFGVSLGKRSGVTIELLDVYRGWAPWRFMVYDVSTHEPICDVKLRSRSLSLFHQAVRR